MITKFSDFDLSATVLALKPARVFLRRRDPQLRAALKQLLPDGAYTFCEITDAPLLLREVSKQLLSWKPGETLEITMGERTTADDGSRDVLIGFRRPQWKRGAILVTALSQSPAGDEEEYGSALILGPGEWVSLAPDAEPVPEQAVEQLRAPLKLAS